MRVCICPHMPVWEPIDCALARVLNNHGNYSFVEHDYNDQLIVASMSHFYHSWCHPYVDHAGGHSLKLYQLSSRQGRVGLKKQHKERNIFGMQSWSKALVYWGYLFLMVWWWMLSSFFLKSRFFSNSMPKWCSNNGTSIFSPMLSLFSLPNGTRRSTLALFLKVLSSSIFLVFGLHGIACCINCLFKGFQAWSPTPHELEILTAKTISPLLLWVAQEILVGLSASRSASAEMYL